MISERATAIPEFERKFPTIRPLAEGEEVDDNFIALDKTRRGRRCHGQACESK